MSIFESPVLVFAAIVLITLIVCLLAWRPNRRSPAEGSEK